MPAKTPGACDGGVDGQARGIDRFLPLGRERGRIDALAGVYALGSRTSSPCFDAQSEGRRRDVRIEDQRAQREAVRPEVVIRLFNGQKALQTVFRDGGGFGAGRIRDADAHRMAAARTPCEEGVGKGDRQAQVALPGHLDALGRAVQRFVAVVADAYHDALYGGHRGYHVTFRGGCPGDEILRLVHGRNRRFRCSARG